MVIFHFNCILLWIERNFFRNSQVPQKVIFDDLILTFLKWLSVIRDKSYYYFLSYFRKTFAEIISWVTRVAGKKRTILWFGQHIRVRLWYTTSRTYDISSSAVLVCCYTAPQCSKIGNLILLFVVCREYTTLLNRLLLL